MRPGPGTFEDLHVNVFQLHAHTAIHVKLLINRICEKDATQARAYHWQG